MPTGQNKALVRQLIEEIINGGNLDLVDEIIAADFVEHEVLPPGLPSGREGFKQETELSRFFGKKMALKVADKGF